MKFNVNLRKGKAELPEEVFKAFERLNRTWSAYTNEDERNLMFLILVGVYSVGDALTLKQFALKNPTTYIKALANGYTVDSTNTEKEVAAMVKKWTNTPYKDDNIDEDIMGFAKEITSYFQKK